MLFLRCNRIDLTHLPHLILLVHPVGPGSEWDRVPFVATSRVLGPQDHVGPCRPHVPHGPYGSISHEPSDWALQSTAHEPSVWSLTTLAQLVAPFVTEDEL